MKQKYIVNVLPKKNKISRFAS